jgi:hypothetical protein
MKFVTKNHPIFGNSVVKNMGCDFSRCFGPFNDLRKHASQVQKKKIPLDYRGMCMRNTCRKVVFRNLREKLYIESETSGSVLWDIALSACDSKRKWAFFDHMPTIASERKLRNLPAPFADEY